MAYSRMFVVLDKPVANCSENEHHYIIAIGMGQNEQHSKAKPAVANEETKSLTMPSGNKQPKRSRVKVIKVKVKVVTPQPIGKLIIAGRHLDKQLAHAVTRPMPTVLNDVKQTMSPAELNSTVFGAVSVTRQPVSPKPMKKSSQPRQSTPRRSVMGAPLKVTDHHILAMLKQYTNEIIHPDIPFITFNQLGNPVCLKVPSFEEAALRCGLTRQHLHRRCCAKDEIGQPKASQLWDAYNMLKTAIAMIWLEAGLSKAIRANLMIFVMKANRMYEDMEETPKQMARREQTERVAQQKKLDEAYEQVLADLRIEKEQMQQRALSIREAGRL